MNMDAYRNNIDLVQVHHYKDNSQVPRSRDTPDSIHKFYVNWILIIGKSPDFQAYMHSMPNEAHECISFQTLSH